MKITTIIILALGAVPILFEVGEVLRERLTYPYRIDDIGLPWAALIVEVSTGLVMIGLIKFAVDEWLAKRRETSNSRTTIAVNPTDRRCR